MPWIFLALYSLVFRVKNAIWEAHSFQFRGLKNFENSNNRKMQELKSKPGLLKSTHLNKKKWFRWIFFPTINISYSVSTFCAQCAFRMTIRAYIYVIWLTDKLSCFKCNMSSYFVLPSNLLKTHFHSKLYMINIQRIPFIICEIAVEFKTRFQTRQNQRSKMRHKQW